MSDSNHVDEKPELIHTKSQAVDYGQTSRLCEEAKHHTGDVIPPPTVFNQSTYQSHCPDMEHYQKMYNQSIDHPSDFWSEQALKHLSWFSKFTQVQSGQLIDGSVAWFLNGKLNASYNCLDRHIEAGLGSKLAIIYEGDTADEIRHVTYNELFGLTCQFANVLKRRGVRKGDKVCIYLPNIVEAVVAMLACARIGAAHSVVFAGFSSEALRERIEDGHCQVVVTSDEGKRGGKIIHLKNIVDHALELCENQNLVHSVIVFQRTGGSIKMKDNRDIWWHDAIERERAYCPCEWMDSEDILFMLFTSGSTGKPKGIQHSTAGYLLYALMTTRYVFDLQPSDRYACMADVGWITGHSYIVYGPLLNGATTFVFESTPVYPNAQRYWEMVERHQLTQLYTAPTAIRALMKYGETPIKKHNRSSLRVLGTVGEPINPEAWRWWYDVVGDSKCAIVDTYWQTETGGHMLTPLPASHSVKPGSATLPFFGIKPIVLTPEGKVVEGNDVSGVLCISQPWPGMARTIYGDHKRFCTTYLTTYPGYYFTGDGCYRDADGYYWITGRVDDVINVSGHRIGSAEVESALVLHQSVAEAAVIGIPHDVKGQSLFAYVIPKDHVTPEQFAKLSQELALQVREQIGAFARPDEILITQAMPKTRSGKIMRRILRKVACNEHDTLGDISTLADEAVVGRLINEVLNMRQQAKAARASSPLSPSL